MERDRLLPGVEVDRDRAAVADHEELPRASGRVVARLDVAELALLEVERQERRVLATRPEEVARDAEGRDGWLLEEDRREVREVDRVVRGAAAVRSRPLEPREARAERVRSPDRSLPDEPEGRAPGGVIPEDEPRLEDGASLPGERGDGARLLRRGGEGLLAEDGEARLQALRRERSVEREGDDDVRREGVLEEGRERPRAAGVGDEAPALLERVLVHVDEPERHAEPREDAQVILSEAPEPDEEETLHVASSSPQCSQTLAELVFFFEPMSMRLRT